MSNQDSQSLIETNVDNPTDTIVSVDTPEEVQNEGVDLQTIPSPPTVTTPCSSIKGVKRLVIQCLIVIGCGLLLLDVIGEVASHLDISKAKLNISTLLSFAYDIVLLDNRVRFLIVIVTFGDIQPSMKFIWSRMAATIDVVFEMESKLGNILLAVAASIGIVVVILNKPNLDLPPGKLVIELAGIPILFVSTIFQVMHFDMRVIIYSKKVQEWISTHSGPISCPSCKHPLEIFNWFMAAVRTYVTVHYWALRVYGWLLVIWGWLRTL